MRATFHHVGLVVSDLERSVEFYRERFDFEVTNRLETRPEDFGPLLGVDRAGADIAFLERDDLTLELEAHEDGATSVSEETDPRDVGFPHLCFEVDDVRRTYEEHRDELDFVSPPGSATDSGATIVYLADPDGNLIELLSR